MVIVIIGKIGSGHGVTGIIIIGIIGGEIRQIMSGILATNAGRIMDNGVVAQNGDITGSMDGGMIMDAGGAMTRIIGAVVTEIDKLLELIINIC